MYYASGYASDYASDYASEHFYVSQLSPDDTPEVPVATPDDREVNSSELLLARTRADAVPAACAPAVADDDAAPAVADDDAPATADDDAAPAVDDDAAPADADDDDAAPVYASCSVEGCPAVPYANPLYQYSSSYGTGDVGGDVGPVGCNDLGLPAQWNVHDDDADADADGDYYSDRWKSVRLGVKGPVYNYSEPDALGLTC